jgi:hypothetical protein
MNFINYINSHDGCTAKLNDAGDLEVTGLVQFSEGHFGYDTEVIPNTLESVRNWLGY